MRYYTVWVRSQRYRGNAPLTYSCDRLLTTGQIVAVPLQREQVLGFVSAAVASKPAFVTKSIAKIYDLPPLPAQLLQLGAWLQRFYASTIGTVTQQLLPAGLSDKAIEQSEAVVINSTKPPLYSLNNEQNSVVKNITNPDTYLLHGRTGSGKTRVYIELALQAIATGKSALILVPEIGLTSQLAQNFQDVFGNRVVVLHSQLTPAERQRVWLRILCQSSPLEAAATGISAGLQTPRAKHSSPVERTAEMPVAAANAKDTNTASLAKHPATMAAGSKQQPGVPLIVIGPRSALFSPLSTIGLIVVDEAHETAYKQEQAPYYHAGRVASQLARLHGATLIFGSATPSISDYFLAEQRGKPILEMKELATSPANRGSTSVLAESASATGGGKANPTKRPAKAAPPPGPTEITLVDLKDCSQFSRSQHLSTPLLRAITEALARGEQSLVYLNRRGTARVVLCEHCGWQALCPRCDLPLIYHGDTGRLRCHTCGFSQVISTTCPVCSYPSILFKSFGTKAIYEELQHLFPQAKIQRFDTDNKKSERFEQHYTEVKRGEVDILVGTQLLAKGLDLPHLSTLGVVLADSSLYLPDFSAQERTYQLLSQILGRVGRGHLRGHAILQTYHTDNPILQAVVTGDWDTFYRDETAQRQKFHFPPFYHLLKLSCRRASAKSAEAAAAKLKQLIASAVPGIEVDGPAPSFHEKLSGKYQYQLIVKSTDRSKLLDVIRHLPASGWSYDIDPINLL